MSAAPGSSDGPPEGEQPVTELRATVGPTHWTPYAKRQTALAMYARGHNFVLAASLLSRHQGHDDHVVLHLLCQGVEIVLKAMLRLRAFDTYTDKLLRSKAYGHDLEALAKTALAEFGLRQLRPGPAEELARLNHHYRDHRLRYASLLDFFLDPPETLSYRHTLQRLRAVNRLAKRNP